MGSLTLGEYRDRVTSTVLNYKTTRAKFQVQDKKTSHSRVIRGDQKEAGARLATEGQVGTRERFQGR